MSLSKSDSLPVDATFVATAGNKATGVISLFNSYSTVAQTIVANSRLVNNKGNIYRTTKSVSIPGYKTVNGKKVPGSIDVKVIADKIGEEYNLKFEELSGDFTLPGLETNPDKYKLVFGRQKTDIVGGTAAGEYKLSSTTSAKAKTSIMSQLTNELLGSYRNQIPNGYISPDNTYVITFDPPEFKNISDSKVEMTLKANLQAIILKKDTLGRFLAGDKLNQFRGAPVIFGDLDKLQFKLEKPIKTLTGEMTLKTKVSGEFKITGEIQADLLKKALAGRNVSDLPSVNQQFPGIKSSNLHITPLWFRTLPDDVDKIDVEIQP
jgi:hypothetical protein